MSVDRLPPHSIEAEQGILGCVLLDPKLVHDVSPEWFYDLRHRSLLDALKSMADAGMPIDLLTVQQRLRDRNQLEAAGGLGYLASLPDATPSAGNLPYFAGILKEKHLLRRMIQVGTELATKAHDNPHDPQALLDEFERDALAIRQHGIASEADIKTLLRECVADMEDAVANRGKLRGVGTGYPDLDRMTSGLRPQQIFVIAARPSIGKTSLAMNMAEHVAVNDRIPVGVFSLEMSAKELTFRMVCSRARVDSSAATVGEIDERHISRLTGASAQIAKAPIHIVDAGGLTIGQLRAKARRLVQQHGVKMLVVDYLQLVSSGRRTENRSAEITVVSNQLKAMAKELDIPVIVLSQLNRESEKDSRKPRLSDLRESGAIEQDADLVALLHRSAEPDGDNQPVEMIIAKQRNGRTGKIDLMFRRQFTRFESVSRIGGDE